MHKAPVIGISGFARSGKDTTANFILASQGGYIYSFADPIRAMLRPLGVDMSDPYWQANKEVEIPVLGVSPRRLMQTLGTEWGRQLIHPDLWLILAKQRLVNAGPGMIIADVRFENEAAWVRSQGGRIVHLVRKGRTVVEAHPSEDGINVSVEDVVLHNDGDLSNLQHRVKELFSGS